MVWPPGQRARELLLLLAGASVLKGLLAQAVRGFKERCKADGNPLHAEGERRRSGWQEWSSSGRSGPAPHRAGGSGPWGVSSGLGLRLLATWSLASGLG